MADPYEGYLRQAADLFAAGEVVKAGQIWQAILKQMPSHAEARAGLLNVKAILEARKAAQAAPRPEAPPKADPDTLLREGCTLYDMGQIEEALRVWERLLAHVPGHPLAQDYANAARRELGLQAYAVPSKEAGPASAPASLEPPPTPPLMPDDRHDENPDLDKLLREAVQLYDMGLPEEAIAKWEQALAQAPERQDITAFIREARKELESRASAPQPAPAPAAPLSPSPKEDPVAAKLRQGRHLLSLRRFDEAAFTFQQALGLDPGNPEAMEGLQAAHRGEVGVTSASSPDASLGEGASIALAEAPTAAQAQPPAALIRSQPGGREGLQLPPSMAKAGQALERYPWLRDPKVLMGAGAGLLLLATTCSFLKGKRAEAHRREEVQAVSEAALAEAARASNHADLTEKPKELMDEAKEALEDGEPLKAFCLAERVLALLPGDGPAAKLLEEARGALPGGVAGPSLAEAQRHVQEGNLEAAAKVYDALLRQDPSDLAIRAKAARVALALASRLAAQEKWDQAEHHLRLGRALQPANRTWALRLHMLAYVRTLPKGNVREAWMAFLG